MATKRLIDAEHLHRYALCEYMRAKIKHKDEPDFEHWAGIVVAMVEELLKGMPTVDAVEVVRCKDCKHWLKDVPGCTDAIGRCRFANYMVGANGYCVYGERKDNGLQ